MGGKPPPGVVPDRIGRDGSHFPPLLVDNRKTEPRQPEQGVEGVRGDAPCPGFDCRDLGLGQACTGCEAPLAQICPPSSTGHVAPRVKRLTFHQDLLKREYRGDH